MSTPSIDSLLSSLDALGHSARMAQVAALARGGGPDLGTLTRALVEHEEAYPAQLGLVLAAAVRDAGAARLGLRHAVADVRAQAARLAVSLGLDAAALREEVDRASASTRGVLVKAAALRGTPGLADALLDDVVERWPQDAARLLAGCSATVVARWLPELEHVMSSWQSLVRRHPDLVLDHLGRRFQDAPRRAWDGLWVTLAAPLSLLVRVEPAGVLQLALNHAPDSSLPSVLRPHLGRCTSQAPDLLFALLTRPGYRSTLISQGLPRPVARQVRRLRVEQRERLARLLFEEPSRLAELLEAVAPSEREGLFQAACEGRDTAHTWWDRELLDVLPHRLREREATRMAGLRAARESRPRRLTALSCQRLATAREELFAACRASKPEERGPAWARLIAASGRERDPGELATTLEALQRTVNEQDPVRLAIFRALAHEVPPCLYADEHVPQLEALIRGVVEARDTSPATRSQVQALALRLLRAHADQPQGAVFTAAIEALGALVDQGGVLHLSAGEGERLPPDAARRLLEALAPRIDAAQARDEHQLVLQLAEALGRRGWDLDALQRRLEPATRATTEWLARQAIRLWLAAPATRDQRARALLDRDPTCVALPEVAAHLHLRRQEWLDPFLTGQPLRGRFVREDLVAVPDFAGTGFHRWLPRQQERLAALLRAVVQDEERDQYQRTRAVHRLAALPLTRVAQLIELADAQSVDAEPVALFEAALGATVRSARPQDALPLLLEQLGGDRARVAAYALMRCGRHCAPGDLERALPSVVDGVDVKLTSRKEALRLLGALRPPGALAVLTRALVPDLHKDLKIALGHAARALLPGEGAWPLLEALAQDPNPHVAESLLAASPHRLARAARDRYAQLLLSVTEHPELRTRRAAWLQAGAWSPGCEEVLAARAGARVRDLGASEWSQAVAALVTACRDGAAAGALLAVVSGLATTPLEPAHDAGAERDEPARQRLARLLGLLANLPGGALVRLAPTLEGLAARLEQQPTLTSRAAQLRVLALDWKVPASAGAALQALAARTPPLGASGLAARVASALARPDTEWDPQGALEVVDALADSGGPPASLVAVGVLAAAGGRTRWDEACVARLRRLRAHADPVVAAAARDLWTASE
jgi:hypothetical protein